MILIERITPDTALVFKQVRLRALAESPAAFSSTYDRESQFPDEEWVRRAARWGGEGNDAIFLAFDGEAACGIVGSYIEKESPERAQVISMWVDPEYRRSGVGKLLIDTVMEFNRAREIYELVLMVTSVNMGAIAFYEQLGFRKTGAKSQYPNDPSIIEYEMMLRLA